MEGQAYINGKDIYTTWGASFIKGAYEALLAPPPVKELISNKCRLLDGKTVIHQGMKTDERNLNLPFFLTGTTRDDYLDKYRNFLKEITSGLLLLKVPELRCIYKLTYVSCASYGDYGTLGGKIVLKLNEPNIKDREML